MRLLYVNGDPGIPFHGPKGASVHVRRITQALARRTDSVEVVTARRGRPDSGADATGPETGDGIRILVPQTSSAPRPDGSAAAVAREADALLRDEALSRVLDDRLARGGVDVIWERYSLWSTAAANAAANAGIPWVLEVNAPLAEEAARHRSLALPGLAGYLQRARWRGAAAVFAVSRELARTIVAAGANPARVHVLPNGYDDRAFRARSAAADGGSRDRPFTVAFVGSLKPWHGVDRLVDAFLKLRAGDADWRLLLIGDGPLAGPLRERLERSAPEGSFEITGAVPHDDVPGRLAAADVAVAPYPPSDDFYFSPLKVVEYAALGLPIVASRIGQIAELLEDGRNALLTEPGDVGELAAALRRLRADDTLRAALGSAAHDAVRDHTWDRVAARALRVIEELVPAPTTGASAAAAVALPEAAR